ncbi:MAG: MFS transporter [Anaerolineaceae bacterium]|nr:MFS transporter [Anaerolineaceae bacterium]
MILLLGIVSAFGDITYETARSVSGPYLLLLGAGAGVVGAVSGLGELLGYGLRLASGYLVDRTKAYWLATFIGYGMLLCVPLLAFAGRWETAALLLILERVGKAVRSPARDTILSHAARQTGRGWGFGLHEALDQIGAVAGPLIFAAVFAVRSSYRDGFSILWIPALLTLVALVVAYRREPSPERLETPTAASPQPTGLTRTYWLYAGFAFLSVAGFAAFPLLAYHWITRQIVMPGLIPVLYAGAMGVDALAALAVGKAYDRIGMRALVIIPFMTLPVPFLGFSNNLVLIVAGLALWGVVMAVHETVLRAAIADLTQTGKRGMAYGIFNTIYGAAWFTGGALMGLLYERSLGLLLGFAAVCQVLAFGVYLFLRRDLPAAPAREP